MASVNGEPSAKRAKIDGTRASFLREDLLTEASRSDLRQHIATSQPYTHGVLENLADKEFMIKVRDEIIHNIQATYKETDLFKVFQTGAPMRACSLFAIMSLSECTLTLLAPLLVEIATHGAACHARHASSTHQAPAAGDLANMDSLEPENVAKLSNLLALRDAIYSQEFRGFIRDITGEAICHLHDTTPRPASHCCYSLRLPHTQLPEHSLCCMHASLAPGHLPAGTMVGCQQVLPA
jgi:hypothetical protein